MTTAAVRLPMRGVSVISRRAKGLAVRQIREKMDLSLQELSTLSGITPSALSRKERGMTKIRPPEMQAIARALKVEVADILSQAQKIDGRAESNGTQQ